MTRHIRYLGLLLPLFTFSSWAAEQNAAVHIAPAGSQNAVYGPAGTGNSPWRCRLLPARRQALAWRRARQRHDASGRNRDSEWQKR